MAECRHGQQSLLPQHTSTHKEASNEPVVIVWRRGSSLSVCTGTSNYAGASPDVAFHPDLTKARRFATATAAFDFLRTKFLTESFIKRMINSGAFEVWTHSRLTAQKDKRSLVSKSEGLLGDSAGAQSAPCAANS